jgi:hypothetical protein
LTSALQLFGNVTFWMFWSNGFEAMRALDDNQDGTLAGGELRVDARSRAIRVPGVHYSALGPGQAS